MFELLGLFQARSNWSGAELAGRLGVTDRTLRRDVERLRSLGYPVQAVPGRYGGYQLGRGARMPPLLLNDDEAVAVAIGLRSAVDGTVTGLEDAAVSALAKLDQLLAAPLAARARAVHDGTARVPTPWPVEPVSAPLLALLAAACAARERVRFEYTDKGRRSSRRLAEPIGVVRHGSRWYLAARDLDRDGWRTFRLDRIQSAEAIGTRFEHADRPDPVDLVTAGLAAAPYPYTARIALPVTLAEATRLIPRTVATFESRGRQTIVEVGSASRERMVSYLAGLRPPARVLEPGELRAALAEHARQLALLNSRPAPTGAGGP
jgi:predicted DNA-binding transcriptional regulator YafY